MIAPTLFDNLPPEVIDRAAAMFARWLKADAEAEAAKREHPKAGSR